MIKTEPVRGMKDYVGNEAKEIVYLENFFREVMESANYTEVISPVIEDFSLFSIKGGEELRKTMYTFKDKADRELTLRPEITPAIARVYLDRLQSLPKPVKLYYIGTVYRYDEPQYGRYREFRQAGVEVLGAEGSYADILVINDLYNFYDKIGMNKIISINLNNIRLIRRILESMEVPEEAQEHILHLIDKGFLDDALKEINKSASKYKENADIIFDILSAGEISESKLEEMVKTYHQFSDDFSYLSSIYSNCKSLGIPVKLNMGLVRGLAYYTGIIFEVKSPDVTFSIAGGGRYDKLIELYGGSKTPAVGFAVGIERTILAGRNYIKIPEKPKIIIFNINNKSFEFSIKIASLLRKENYIVDIDIKGLTLTKAIPFYIEQGFNFMIIIGEKELQENKVTIRDLAKKTQSTIDVTRLIEVLKQML
ncbi:histidine--tRNA ligase [Sulfuracidifex tepidarius]|uniref:Histidine--tRNA ligase n=1 Tax=Sulfuracidifex tepidarius TaxID=1294262 RepID=A0A510E3W5_9CREN|nr:histidine--tRNA ligase [Sulfuracidifex tepidarius]BBG24454.1 Histidine--tRNA ligase [Sulfuracidifex tepidarius]BBG27212.1 Histidine--tRNA ligase [Sulfuracidifex tepidarius]